MPNNNNTFVYIYPYKTGSESVRSLREYANIRILKRTGSQFKGAEDKIVINWGNSVIDNHEILKCQVINNPSNVAICANKKDFFLHCAHNPELKNIIPPFALGHNEAHNLLESLSSKMLFARTKLTGHSGEGIVKCKTLEDIERLPKGTLFVGYIRKKEEYRLHFFRGEIISVQHKLRKREIPDDKIDWEIRSHDNGFIFARNVDFNIPQPVFDVASIVMKNLGLHFGALDIIYNYRENKAYCLEVNTAPGLEGETIANYSNAIEGLTKRNTNNLKRKRNLEELQRVTQDIRPAVQVDEEEDIEEE